LIAPGEIEVRSLNKPATAVAILMACSILAHGFFSTPPSSSGQATSTLAPPIVLAARIEFRGVPGKASFVQGTRIVGLDRQLSIRIAEGDPNYVVIRLTFTKDLKNKLPTGDRYKFGIFFTSIDETSGHAHAVLHDWDREGFTIFLRSSKHGNKTVEADVTFSLGLVGYYLGEEA
jgi:hypothetical protein